MRTFTFSVGILIAGLAVAQPVQGNDSADTLIDKAALSFAEMDFEKAIRLLDQALGLPGNSRQTLVRIFHLRGLCLGSLQRTDASRKDFARLLNLDPTFRLGSDVSPRVREPFDELLRERPRSLSARVVPPPAAVLGEDVVITYFVEANRLGLASRIKVFFRRGETGRFSSVTADVGEGDRQLSLPAVAWQAQPVASAGLVLLSWFAVVEGERATRLVELGSEANPQRLEVVEKLSDQVAAEAAWYQRWWVWTLVGGAVVAAATATAVVLAMPEEPGRFDFTVDFSIAP